jgi:hypothetical protein
MFDVVIHTVNKDAESQGLLEQEEISRAEQLGHMCKDIKCHFKLSKYITTMKHFKTRKVSIWQA